MANIRLIIECDTVAQLADELVKQLTSIDAKYARVEFNGDCPFTTDEINKSAPTAVPTTPTSYTLDQLIEAVTPLARDNTKVPQLQSLINGKYGVVGLNELPAEAYGAFAADIRAMGARI